MLIILMQCVQKRNLGWQRSKRPPNTKKIIGRQRSGALPTFASLMLVILNAGVQKRNLGWQRSKRPPNTKKIIGWQRSGALPTFASPKFLKIKKNTEILELHLSKSPLPGWADLAHPGKGRERSRPLPAYHLRSMGWAFWPLPAYLEFLNTCI